VSLSWPAVVGTYINITVNTLGAVGTGDYTVVALTNLNGVNHGVVSLGAPGPYDYQILSDTGTWFGGGDFSGFAGTPGAPVVGDWQIIGQSKTSGANAYRWHFWDYTTNSAKVHTAGSGTHANPGTITSIRLGDSENRGNGLIAAIAIWKRQLSDAEFDSLCTSNLSDWMAVSGGAPDAIWAMNVAAASVVDGTGNGNNVASVVGTISAGADPPGFNYTLTATAANVSEGRSIPPPHLLDQFAAARRQAFQDSRTPATVTGTASATLGGLTATVNGTPVSTDARNTQPPVPPLPLLRRFAAERARAFQPDRTPATEPGVLASALGALAATAAGTRTVVGIETAALGALTASATGTRTVTGVLTAALGGLTATAAAGAAAVMQPGTELCGALAVTAAGTRTATGATAAGALGRLVATATGTRTARGATATAALGALSASAAQSTGSHLAGEAHGPLPSTLGAVTVHTGSIAGAIT